MEVLITEKQLPTFPQPIKKFFIVFYKLPVCLINIYYWKNNFTNNKRGKWSLKITSLSTKNYSEKSANFKNLRRY